MLSRSLSVLAAIALGAGTGATTPEDGNEIEFAEIARRFFQERKIDDSTLDFPGLLATSHFVHVELGSFDLHAPVWAIGSAETAEAFERVAKTLLALQETWFEWRDPETYSDDVQGDWKTLAKWVDGWSSRRLASVEGGTKSLYDELDATDRTRAAQERLRAYTKPPQATIEAVGDLSVFVVAPTRRDFIQLIAAGGQLHPADRGSLWNESVLRQATGWVGWIQVVALEYPRYPIDPEAPFEGASMNQRDATGFDQYMADRGAAFLLRKEFWRHGTHFFEESLGTNLVIAAVGVNDLDSGEWYIGYKSSGGRSQPYQRFVPGGNPSGGVLPARPVRSTYTSLSTAISSYRSDKGRAFFAKSLRDGQKAGYKLAKQDKSNPLRTNKSAHFELVASRDSDSDPLPMTAPFLGESSQGKELPPNEFLDDYEDFFRAYRSCFVGWLAAKGGESRSESAALFSTLIEKHAHRSVDTPLDDVILEVYGVPISTPDPSVGSLEWRYLKWLKKGR